MPAGYDAIGSTSRIRYAISIAQTEGMYENVDVIRWLILLFEISHCAFFNFYNSLCMRDKIIPVQTTEESWSSMLELI